MGRLWVRQLRLRWQALFHRSRLETDLDDELRDHLAREIERQMEAGAPRAEAHRAALAALHGRDRLKEECREARGTRWLEDALSDLVFAVRTLRKAPAFAAGVIGALAFCIAANSAIFSVVDTVLLRPLPFPDQQRLVSVTEGVPGFGFPAMPFSCPDYLFVAANTRSFEAGGTYRTQPYEISGAGRPRRLFAARTTASLFGVLRIKPLAGRTFTRAEDEGSKRVAVLSYAFARATFGSAGQALGRTVLLDRIPYAVIGVMPREFLFPIRGSRFNGDPAELFIPVSWTQEDRQQNVSNFDYSTVARLRPGLTVRQAQAELNELLKRIEASYPPRLKQALERTANFSLEGRVAPLRNEFTGSVQRPLMLLLAAVGLLLLIGCADVANLILSRLAARRREFALRTALGAGRGRLVRQALTEGLLLSTCGGVLGLCLAFWALPLLVGWAPANLPRSGEIGLDGRVLLFVAAICLVTPLLFCLAPLLTTTLRSALIPQLQADGRANTQDRGQQSAMSLAVIAQFSLAFVLLISAGLLARSFWKASAANPGFQPEHVVRTRVALPDAVYRTGAQRAGFFDRLLARINSLPGVRAAGVISDLPLDSTSNVVISVEGRGAETERVDLLFCRGSALDALGVKLLRGRLLQPADQVRGQPAAVISETLARRLWPHSDPLGRRLRLGVDIPNDDNQWLSVVGVVADVKAHLTSDAPRALLVTTPPEWVSAMDIVVRSSVSPLALAHAIPREIKRLDSSLPASRIETLDQVLAASLSAERFRTWLLVSFALAAMLLATLGIAGLLAYNAARRTREFGLRIALGAGRRQLLVLVLRHSLRLSLTGSGVGLLASLLVTRALSALLYGVSPLDPGTFLAVPAILTAVGLIAALLPAWRVIQTDPMAALRAE